MSVTIVSVMSPSWFMVLREWSWYLEPSRTPENPDVTEKKTLSRLYLCQHHISLIITMISMAEHKTTSTSHRYYCQSILLRKINIRISKRSIAYVLLSHSSLEWLYVFSLFPPPPLLPPQPPPQRLFLLTSKPFELNLRYLWQRKYRSRKMYWMTFWWTWLKVTVVTLINKNFLLCKIK